MKNRRLKVGIAGYGVVGKQRRYFIDQHHNLQTVAVCDKNFTKPIVMPDGIRCFSNYKQLLKEPLDILFISLPNYLASEVTIAGLGKDLHVFCEKPPASNLAGIKAVMEAKNKKPDLILKYGFNHRYHDSVREALRLIKTGDFGEIINVRGVYGKSKIIPFSGGWRAQRKYAGGGILLDQGIHMVDLMRLFCGEFTEVKSFVSNSFWKHDVEDNAYALMRDSHGRIAMLHSSATQWQHRFAFEITLTKGYIELQGILSGSKSYGEERLVIGRRDESDTGAAREEAVTYFADNSWRDEVFEFADAIVNGEQIKSGSITDAYLTMKLVYEIYYTDPQWRKKFNIPLPE